MEYTKELHKRMREQTQWKKAFPTQQNEGAEVKCLLDEIDRLQSLTQWVPVTESQPEIGEVVLVCKDDYAPIVCEYSDMYDYSRCGQGDFILHGDVIEATHWMPLPLPPEGVK